MKKLCVLFVLSLTAILSNGQFSKLYEFTDFNNNAYANLVSDGTYLYGMTSSDGANSKGTVFKIKPDGSGFTDLMDFAGASNGSDPWGSFLYDGTYLYGMTQTGGTANSGTIFKIKPDGTGYVKLYDFDGATNGSNPFGSLISDGTYLYGTTEAGGSGYGLIFKIKKDGTGYTVLSSFGGVTGRNPHGSLYYDGTYLYGMATDGGVNLYGTIFKVKSDGTGFTQIYDFTADEHPYGSLISDGTYLYGMTFGGGTHALGTVFKIMPDGTGYNDILDFAGTANGSNPYGSLYYDGTYLYGLTSLGGANNGGVAFKVKPDGTGFLDLYDFSFADGLNPHGDLYSDGVALYGMTVDGGTNFGGTVFKLTGVAGITESKNVSSINIYPNPSSGMFFIDNKEKNATGYNLSVYNVLGECIRHTYNNSMCNVIDLTAQPRGIYFLQLQTVHGIQTVKLILQ